MTIQQVDPGLVPYQILDVEGKLVGEMPGLSAERLLSLYRFMQLGRAFSNKIIALQRQGRATTFGSLVGQEATAVGLAAPLQPQDWLATSYREIASLFVRGVPVPTVAYSFRGFTPENWPAEAHCLPYQIVIGTQMLHAVGLAMAGTPFVAARRIPMDPSRPGDLKRGNGVACGRSIPLLSKEGRPRSGRGG